MDYWLGRLDLSQWGKFLNNDFFYYPYMQFRDRELIRDVSRRSLPYLAPTYSRSSSIGSS